MKDTRGSRIFASRKEDPYLEKDLIEAVIIVPILKQKGKPNKLVAIREFRVPVGGYTYGFPAGLVGKRGICSQCRGKGKCWKRRVVR